MLRQIKEEDSERILVDYLRRKVANIEDPMPGTKVQVTLQERGETSGAKKKSRPRESGPVQQVRKPVGMGSVHEDTDTTTSQVIGECGSFSKVGVGD